MLLFRGAKVRKKRNMTKIIIHLKKKCYLCNRKHHDSSLFPAKGNNLIYLLFVMM